MPVNIVIWTAVVQQCGNIRALYIQSVIVLQANISPVATLLL